MMLGKRSRAPVMKRTTSMKGITTVDSHQDPPHNPIDPEDQGHLMNVHDINCSSALLSPRYYNRKLQTAAAATANFLRSCGLCNRRLVPGRDIYMYRGDTAFCSQECREQQMKQDESKERHTVAAAAGSSEGTGETIVA
ncbi:hypothetical protein M9H77_19772 [Catharanthus roseus]|uniref:Uncharacterized protein n=1 Tax=Catharanthus roseus TaxID=4058 RepID=A0ACC0BB73_CATRO|nr:hypothetical protein M9H77_19772 [Catharanthus roseus]